MSRIQDYIQLDRKFVEFDERLQAGEREDSLFAFDLSSTGKSWSDILKNRCTVILAEAGSGKTTELRAQTERLRSEGQPAFFCRLEILAGESFEDALEIGTSQDFQSWRDSDAHGYFFLDSVDEARLASPGAFEKAVIHFAKVARSYMHRSTVVISTRPNVWQAQADPAMLRRRLDLPEEEVKQTRDDGTLPEMDEAKVYAALFLEEVKPAGGETTGVEKNSFGIMQMSSLNQSQIQTFAEAKGITDITAFMEAINRADTDVFATRPADLPGLIDAWKKDEPFGSYSEVVLRNIELKLSEENPIHGPQAPLSQDRALEGARVLAAAVTLTTCTSILLPDDPIEETLREKCLDPKEVLPDWQPAEIRALLGRALFEEALYGSVRFHHRTPREYLAARWFEQLLLQQKNRRYIEKWFFARPYGVLSEVIVRSFKPIVGWLAAWDQRIRDRALHIDPKVLLEEGDSSTLDIGTRETLLKDFALRYKDRNNTPLSLHIREVRRLVDRQLAGVIRELLEVYRNHVDVRKLLLRLIREGRIPECGQLAYSFVIDTEMDRYTRTVAVQAVGVAGTLDEKKRLAVEILSQGSNLEQDIVGAAIDSLWPDAFTDQDVLTFLEKAPVPGQFEIPTLGDAVPRIASRISDGRRLQNFLAAVLELVSRPPLHSDKICRISKKYDWLPKSLWALARRLNLLHDAPETVPEFLAAISLCARSHDYIHRYRSEMDDEIAQLLHGNAKIRHALFWYEYEQARQVEEEPITGHWFIYGFPRTSILEKGDSDYYLQDIREHLDPVERQIAMSVLFDICDAAKDTALLERIKDAVSGDLDLVAELNRHLAPPVPSEEYLEVQRRRSESDLQRRQQEEEAVRARQEWIERLKANPSLVGNLSLANKGQVWENTYLLLEEISEEPFLKNHLTESRWDMLIPDFGEKVARKFRDFCQDFWRHHSPSACPDNSEDTSHALRVGLSGLAMEADSSETWAAQLTDNEAEIATRYALRELNDFPNWFPSLLQAKPEPVRKVFREEIERECNAFPPDSVSLYLLEKLRSTRLQIGNDLRDDITDILTTKTGILVKSLENALAIVLKNSAPLRQTFRDTVARQAEGVSSEQQKVLWLSALLCLDAERALDIMEAWVNDGTKQDGERRVSLIIGHIWGDDLDTLNSRHDNYMRLEYLLRLLEMVHSHICPEEDIEHDGMYTPDPRDKAQDARGRLLNLLWDIPGKATYDALIRLSKSLPLQSFKDRLLNLADSRAESDTDFKAWSPTQVAEFGRGAERNPTTQRELFEIGLSRLDDIKFDLEEGDDSTASLWRKVDDELELRRVIAARLSHDSHNRYTTSSEEELADKSRTDIRLHNPKVDARIPIEIKIAGKWSANELCERMENQLVGQYLREAQYGIFLLVNRGAKRDKKKYWRSDRRLSFSTLVEWLKNESRTLLNEHVQDIEVIGIDLTRRTGEASRTEKKAGA